MKISSNIYVRGSKPDQIACSSVDCQKRETLAPTTLFQWHNGLFNANEVLKDF